MVTLQDVTEDVRQGKYNAHFDPRGVKIFGRRIFVKIADRILLGHIQYTTDREKQKVIVYVDFNFRVKRNKRSNSPFLMKLVEYNYEDGMDLVLYIRKIRQELLEKEPQPPGIHWSFDPSKVL